MFELVTSGDSVNNVVLGSESSLSLFLVEARVSEVSLPLVCCDQEEPEWSQSPLVCFPLAKIDSMDFSDFLKHYSGDVLALEESMSVWVEQRYKGFRKLVGMHIIGFESECISLLSRIDEARKNSRPESGPCRPPNSSKKVHVCCEILFPLLIMRGKRLLADCY